MTADTGRHIDVLVVEDEPVVRQAARKILGGEGLSVVTANDATEALAILDGARCRLVISDLMLPGLSGFDLLEAIRSRGPELEVIIITGYLTLENALDTFSRGGFDFIGKPFDVGELLGVVQRALRFSARSAEFAEAAPGSSKREPAAGDQAHDFFLGRHSWARPLADGSATLGAAETFERVLGPIARIELPAAEERSTQGRLLGRILAPGEIVNRVWSPLSGTVLATNPLLDKSAGVLDHDPLGEGWLVRIIPDAADRELAVLTQRTHQSRKHG